MKKFLFAMTAAAFIGSPIAAQQGARLSESCRNEVMALCGSAQGKEARRACIKQNRSKVSENCRSEIKARMEARKGAKVRPEGES